MCFGGGGGSSGSSGGNDELWGAQASAARQSSAMSGEMFDYWKRYAPGALSSASNMAQEATDGTLTNRQRATAGADADQSTAQGLAASTRSLDRYGSTLNPNAMAHDSRSAALAGAANKAGAMSKATEWGEGQKWARNADVYSMSSGMQGNAVASANSANSGLANLSSMQNSANSANAANAAGYGTMGATLASSVFKADGGLIRRHFASGGLAGHAAARKAAARRIGVVRGGIRLAGGGMPQSPVVGWRDRVAAMPTIGKTDNSSSPVASMLSGALPTVATEVAKPYMKQGLSAAKDWVKGLGGAADAPIESGMDAAIDPLADAVAAPAAETGAAAAEGAGIGSMEAGSGIAAGAETAEAAAAATEAATAAAAAETAAASATATAATEGAAAIGAANAWNPAGWAIGAGLALASIFGNQKADGGEIEREDMTPGGAVEGKGTETSDSIASWLSDDEYVENAEAVKLPRSETMQVISQWGVTGGSTKDLLEMINEKGLKKRHGDQARMVDGEAKPNGLAGGGMLGVAMGAGANTYNQLQQEKRRSAQIDAEIAMRQQSAAQQATQFEWARLDQAEKTRIRDEGNAVMAKYKPRFEAMSKGDYSSFAPELLKDYNGNAGAFNDGNTASLQSTPQGSVINFSDKNGQVVHSQQVNPQFVKQATQAAMLSELSAISPDLMQKAMNHDLDERKVSATEKTAAAHLLGTQQTGEHLVRSDANAERSTENQLALGKGHLAVSQAGLGIQQQNANMAREKWGIEKPVLESGAKDSETIRTVRQGLVDAIKSKDPAAINDAAAIARTYGVKYSVDEKGSYHTSAPDAAGNVLVVDQRTGAGKVLNTRDMKKRQEEAVAQPKSVATPKPGDTQVIQTGEHKGKTAVYDGSGWALEDSAKAQQPSPRPAASYQSAKDR